MKDELIELIEDAIQREKDCCDDWDDYELAKVKIENFERIVGMILHYFDCKKEK